MTRKYGWIRQLPDSRDFVYTFEKPVELPPSVDLRAKCPPVYDQGRLGSCTAQAIAAAFEYNHVRAKLKDWVPSRLFIYYNERKMEGTIPVDAGAIIQDGIKSVVKQGVCPEAEWPYKIERFAAEPSPKAYRSAAKHVIKKYSFIPQGDVNTMKQALAKRDVVVFGFSVYTSFESMEVARTGIVPMPQPGERRLGGHAVLLVGYDEARQVFIVRNSWGADWGDKGYCYFPYAYLASNLCADFWVVSLVG